MERRRVVVDLEQIDLLEQRIVKATELIRSLRQERDAAQMKFQETMASLERLQGESKNLDKDRHEVQELTGQVEVLQEERQAIRGKVTRMLEMMASLEEAPARAHGDH
jgi:chromosome segregation ATPase